MKFESVNVKHHYTTMMPNLAEFLDYKHKRMYQELGSRIAENLSTGRPVLILPQGITTTKLGFDQYEDTLTALINPMSVFGIKNVYLQAKAPRNVATGRI